MSPLSKMKNTMPSVVVRSRRRAVRAATLSLFAAAVGTLAITPAHAVGTRTFNLDSLDELSGGDLKGVAVSSDGVVRAGFTLGNAPLPESTAVFSALALADGSGVLLGTSPGGKVFKVVGDQVTLFADTGELAVTSMVQAPNGVVYAATIPSGKIFKISQGKADLHATLKDVEHVWALALDKAKTSLFAATGPDGKLFRVAADGSASVYFDSDEPHLISLAVDDASGDVLVGSSGKAILHRVTGPGRASAIFDFPGDEVKAIAIAKGGVVFAISNEYTEPPEPPKRTGNSGRTPGAAVTAARPKPGKGALYRFDAAGRPEKMMSHAEFHYTTLAVDDAGQAYVGTGAEGRVYMVNDAHAVTLIADTDERQIGALSIASAGAKGPKADASYIVSSDPPVFHRVLSRGGADAVWTSKALDAGLRARFGRLAWRSGGAVDVSTRSGNTSAPDATWSAWSATIAQGAVAPSPPGRYVQVRARWGKDANATLSDVMLSFVTDNVRPIVTEVNAIQRGAARESKEGIIASGGEPPRHDSVVKLTWKVENPDSDALRYRLAFKRDGLPTQTVWRDILRSDEVVTKAEYEWDTQALPEGKYRVRVEASDEQANPPDTIQRHALESSPVLVDNTPPVISGLSVKGRRLKAKATDVLGPIARAEVAVDGRLEWRPIAPADGIFDSADEALDADLSSLVPAGAHIVALRVYDAAGNAVVQETESD